MKQHLNTLFVTTEGAYLAKDGEALEVKVDGERRLHIPVITLEGVMCFGRVGASPAALALCAESGVTVTFLTEQGRMLAQVTGFTKGNVLLRRAQYRLADQSDGGVAVARSVVTAKLANSRTVLLRALRDHPGLLGRDALGVASAKLGGAANRVRSAGSLDGVRGIEGEGSAIYFGVFDALITGQRERFRFAVRSRRPPLDPVNALLSFVYTLLVHDVRSACESAGLDAAVGFLHRDRPGRPGLALDLMEEFRAMLADRLVLSLINRHQVRADGFHVEVTGGVMMDDSTRRVVLTAYQERKRECVVHPILRERTTVGMLPHLQARLLARYLRGDLETYPAYVWR